jgi:hypothetical protein
MVASTTRRGVFASAAAVPVLAVVANSATTIPTEADVMEWERLSNLYRDAFNGRPQDQTEDMTLLDLHELYERKVLQAPCVSRRVAAVQLRIGPQQDARDGERTDGLGQAALEKVIRYLEGL